MAAGEGDVLMAVSHDGSMEMNGQFSFEAQRGQGCMGSGAAVDASCLKESTMEACNGTEMRPSGGGDAMEVLNHPDVGICLATQERGMIAGVGELECSGEPQVKEVSNETDLQPMVESHVKDAPNVVPEPEHFPDVQMKEFGAPADLEPCNGTHAEEVLNRTDVEPFAGSWENQADPVHHTKSLVKEAPTDAQIETKEVMNDSEMEPCAENRALEVLDNSEAEQGPQTKAKDASNDDTHSEVSNPKLSPKHVTSSLTFSGQPQDVLGEYNGGCGEITSACSRNSGANGSHCETERSGNPNMESASTSCVVLEIPKHVSTTGITKITFKFSKCKDYYDNQVSQTDALPLSSSGFQDHEWDTIENAEMKIGVVGGEFRDTQSPVSSVPNRELKMSKKITPDNYPTNVKKLLSTGILEGARVKYISISGDKEIPGIIKDGGYLCGCCVCNFSKVVSAYEFELHAGTKTRHPNNHIYLENGNPIYSMVQELRSAPLSKLDDVIKAFAGSSVNEHYFQLWKANLLRGDSMASVDSVDQCQRFGMYISSSYPPQPYEDSPSPASCDYSHISSFNQQSYAEVPVERKRLIKKPRHYFSGSVSEQKKASEGGPKKRDNDLHKLLFMPNGLPDGTDLAYYSKGKKILGGYKQGNGVVCSCCNSEISPSQFEAHAGWAAKRQPYRHIYTSSGLTLHDIALMLANGQSVATTGSDDMCAICGNRGDLIICNRCPRAFHAGCLGVQYVAADDWCCPHCRERFGPGRRVPGEPRPIVLRLTRVVKASEFQPGGCVFCRSQDFSAANFDDRTVILCDQCEKEYHVGCLRESGLCDLKELPKDKWFCCDDCRKIFSALQNLVYSGPELVPASVSAALNEKHPMVGQSEISNTEIQWRILSGKSRLPEHTLPLSQAAAIFRECFDPIVAKSGRDLIPIMVYGRNISGQEFSGMYCVVLLVRSTVVSAALLRIFGRDVAELPLVATSRENQGKGYFQALFSCIERLLLSMNVKRLVLPAAEEAEPMWTKKLGFTKMGNEQMHKFTRDLQLTIFKGTSLLEKEVQMLAV